MKLKPANDRGFLRGEFKDQYGYKCSIQKSSLATSDCIWLGVNEPNPMIQSGDGRGWIDFPLPSGVQCVTRMHLNQRMVKKLLPLLQHFAETGELPS